MGKGRGFKTTEKNRAEEEGSRVVIGETEHWGIVEGDEERLKQNDAGNERKGQREKSEKWGEITNLACLVAFTHNKGAVCGNIGRIIIDIQDLHCDWYKAHKIWIVWKEIWQMFNYESSCQSD